MRLRRDIIHKTTGLGFSKRWVSFHKTTRIFFEGFSHPFFRSGVWVSAFVRSESARRLFDGFEQGLNGVWTGFVQCLFNGCSMAVQWLFNGCSMAVQWLAKGCHHALRPPFSASSMNADAAAVYVSSPMSFFWWLRIEFIWVVVFPGRRGKKSGCLVRRTKPESDSNAADWLLWHTAIRMPCAEVRQGGCLAVFRDVFSTMKTQTERFLSWRKESKATFCKVKQREKTERRDSWTKSKGSWKIICENEWYNLNLHRI